MWAGGTAGEGRDVGVGSKKQSRTRAAPELRDRVLCHVNMVRAF